MADCVLCVGFGKDGKVLAAGTAWDQYRRGSPHGKPELRLWDLTRGAPIGEPILIGDWAAKLAASPDGNILMSVDRSGRVALWDPLTGKPTGKPIRLPNSAYWDAVFRRDSRAILIGTGEGPAEGTARLWDVQTGEPLSAPMTHTAPLVKLAFRPDGAAFAAGYRDGTVRLWDIATAQPVGPPIQLDREVSALAFGPDGRTIVAVAASGDFRRQTFPASEDKPPDAIAMKLAAATGRELSTSEGIRSLVGEAWAERRRDALRGSTQFEAGGDDVSWHEHEAGAAERASDKSGASWHLDKLIAQRPDDGLLKIRRAGLDAAAGRRDVARAAIDRALSLEPREPCLDLLVHRALEAMIDGQNELALWSVDLALRDRPSDWRLHSHRALVLEKLGREGEVDAEMDLAASADADLEFLLRLANRRFEQGRWAEAAALYGRARRDSMIADDDWSRNAVACLLARDPAGYRSVCADRTARASGLPKSLGSTLFLGGICTVGPGAVEPHGWLVERLAKYAAQPPPNLAAGWRNDIFHMHGVVLYRLGRYRDAAAGLRQAVAAIGSEGTPRDQVILAMANHRLGNRDEARRWLAKLPPPQDHRSESFDPDIEILRQEAKALILSEPAFPAGSLLAPEPRSESGR